MPTITTTRALPALPRPGDTVAVVAPAGPVPEEQLRTGVELLESWDLRVEVGEHVTSRHPRLDYLAGSDAERAADLERAWCAPGVKAVFCARGGYGSVRLLDRLDWSAMARVPGKLLVGSSDVTALHEAVGHRLGLASLFGPMIATKAFTEDPPARRHLWRSLFEPEGVRSLTAPRSAALRTGRAAGITHGGNLSVLAGLLGSGDLPSPPSPGLALLEDVTEQPYQLDRYLTQLRRAGWFETASGVVLGSWRDCGPAEGVLETLLDVLGDLGVPVVRELGFGHCEGQLTVPLGVRAELDAEAGTLTVTGPRPD
ncbi:S66 peptidase family protein [Actinopolyspora erythraea]|uniref:S66 peptidase family protein n=1 Tax=Actinopolyspora erythraea TaxID=414996 RepID=UPI000A04AED1|nr:LD-carboxypeptidase [Actinopolyspora erythraea]